MHRSRGDIQPRQASFFSLWLPVICFAAMLSQVMFIVQPAANWLRCLVDGYRKVGGSCHRFQNDRVICRRSRIRSPGEGAMVGDQNRGYGPAVRMFKSPNDCVPCVLFVVTSNLSLR